MSDVPVTRSNTSQPEISVANVPVTRSNTSQPEISVANVGPVTRSNTSPQEVIDIPVSGSGTLENVELINIMDLNFRNVSNLFQCSDGTFILVCSDTQIDVPLPTNIPAPQPIPECPSLNETLKKPSVSNANVRRANNKVKKAPSALGVKVASKDKPKNHVCKICSKRFLKRDHLESHSHIHTGARPFECQHCYQAFNTKSSMVRHIKITHLFEKSFVCSHCDKKLSSSTHLKQHVMRNHSNDRPFHCEYAGKVCDKKYCTKEELQQHIQAVHKVKRPYQCQFCRSKYAYSRNLKRHLRKDCARVPAGYDHAKYVHMVRECNQYKETASGESSTEATEKVVRSEPAVHGFNSKAKRYQCHICSKKLSKSDHLTMHLRIHTGEKPFECTECARCFNTKNSLIRHGRVHSGERPWSCQYCDCTFSTSGQKTVHMRRVHTHEKPYHCMSCPKKFSTHDCLTVHMRLHTGDMPYACQWCEKEFARKPNMKRHEKTCVLRE